MGTDGKYGRIETPDMPDHIPAGEPVIVIRARDKNACPLISRYFQMCASGGSPQRHLDLIEATYKRFADWQEANADQVRTPTSSNYAPEETH